MREKERKLRIENDAASRPFLALFPRRHGSTGSGFKVKTPCVSAYSHRRTRRAYSRYSSPNSADRARSSGMI